MLQEAQEKIKTLIGTILVPRLILCIVNIYSLPFPVVLEDELVAGTTYFQYNSTFSPDFKLHKVLFSAIFLGPAKSWHLIKLNNH